MIERQYIGRYRVLGKLGSGGMGTVLRAMDEVREREVALKLPNDVDPQTISFLQQECAVLTQLEHHNIVQIFGSGSDSDPNLPFYIVMEFVDGVTVEDLLDEQGGRLEPRRALKIALGVAEALAYAHKPPLRIIHRDIKPGNILIRHSDGMVKVTDFGIAAVLSQRTGRTAVGTLAYMAPEQATGLGVDERSDLYALGAMLYEMLTGQRSPQLASAPSRPPSAWLDGANVPIELRSRIDRLTLGLLRANRDQRWPQRADEVAEELRAMLEGRPTRPVSSARTGAQSNAASILQAPTQRATRPQGMGNYPPPPMANYPPPPQPRVTVPQPAYTNYPPAYTGYAPNPRPYATQAPPAYPPPQPAPQPPRPAYQPPPVVVPRGRTHLATVSLLLGLVAVLVAASLLRDTHTLEALRVFHWPPHPVFSIRGAFPHTLFDGISVIVLLACAVPAFLAVSFGRTARRRVLISGKRLRGGALAFFGRWCGYLALLALAVILLVR